MFGWTLAPTLCIGQKHNIELRDNKGNPGGAC